MMNLTTTFVGLKLKSPIIAGSCGLTADIRQMQEMERNGVGAVILKSIFEEQIRMETEQMIDSTNFPNQENYIREYTKAHTIQQYLDLIKEAKNKLTIPVIASINCIKEGEWIDFAQKIEEAGADALELNIFLIPLDEFKESSEVEEIYYNIVKRVKAQIGIPVIVKLGRNFTNLSTFVSKLKGYGADAVTLFNRFYEPDIDIDKMTLGAAPVFSLPTDLRMSLRWTGILAGKDPQLQISSSTGVHDGRAVVKMLLAGATTVQVCSGLYESGASLIQSMNEFVSSWMKEKSFKQIADFKGMLSYGNIENAERYERAQFMKYFSSRNA
ncbi:dihydroorotate dehydrogenase-like protein [Odoribacter sp. OttesenSCG-928-A06]|nr:dihydroorotate dehydrogenase-like protein [Odoribacter sp. OttesenSCG-928-A06]